MITLLQLVESMDKITPASVDAQLSYLWDQRIKRRADLLLIGWPTDWNRATATVHYVNRSMVTGRSAPLRRLIAESYQLPQAVYHMDASSDTIEKLIDYMYTGIYGRDALARDWREKQCPDLCTNVDMFRVATIYGMPELKGFVLHVMARTFRSAFRQDQIVAIYKAWTIREDNSELRDCLLAWEFDAMKTAGLTMDDWLRQTERTYRHEGFEARFRRLARDWGYYPLGV